MLGEVEMVEEVKEVERVEMVELVEGSLRYPERAPS